MNTLKGPFKIVKKEMGITFYINLALTFALFALYFFLSFRVNENENLGVLFGPFFAVFLLYPFLMFKSYRLIISLGGTRKQFTVSVLLATLMFLVIAAVVLNVLYMLGEMIFPNGHMFHMADLINDAGPVMYFWIDLLWLFILFSIGMIVKVIYFNLGTVRTLSGGAILLLAGITVYFYVDFGPFFEFIITDHLLFVHLLAIGAAACLVLSYFMMRNAPLERGDRKLFNTSAVH